VVVTVEQAAMAAIAAIATCTAAIAATAATAVAKGVGLRLKSNENDGDRRQSQRHLKQIALHHYLQTHGQKNGNDQPCHNCAMTTNEDRRSC
jgi:hypothetical protein